MSSLVSIAFNVYLLSLTGCSFMTES